MKKIISILAVAAMMFSSLTAFAAMEYPEGYAPKASVSVTKVEDVNEYGYYLYNMTIDLSDLGNLYHERAGMKYNGMKLNSVDIEVRATKEMDAMIMDPTMDVSGALGAANLGQTQTYTGSDASGFNIVYYANTVNATYPTSGTATACDDAISINFYSMEGTITVGNATIGFLPFKDSAIKKDENGVPYEAAVTTLALDKNSFTIGETKPAAELAISATQVKDTETGYIWDVTLTKGATAPTAFDAKFTDNNDEIAERTIRNFADLVSAKLPEGTGSATFKVGLSTSRTLKAVEFKVTDAAGSATWTN